MRALVLASMPPQSTICSERVRLASIGLGRWARVLAAGAQRGDVIELYSCFSRSEERRTAFQEEFQVTRSAATLKELLADEEVEGVIITTPNEPTAT